MSLFRALVMSVLVLLLSVTGVLADPIDVFSPTEQNLKMMQQAAAMTSIDILNQYGYSPSTLSYTGTYTATSWSLSLAGDYGGQTVGLSFSGTTGGPDSHDDSSGTYSETGTVGGDAWSGSGSWSSSPDSSNTANLSIAWNSSDTVTLADKSKPKIEHDIEVVDEGYLPDGTDFIDYNETLNGEVVGFEHYEESDEDFGPVGRASVGMDFDDEGVFLNGVSDFDPVARTGTVSGTVKIMPLPAAVWSGVVLLGVLGVVKRPQRIVRALPQDA